MTKAVAIAGSVGALVPLFWGIMGFLLFNLREGVFSRLFWAAVHITCPSWAVTGPKSLLLTPLLNALLYSTVTALFVVVRKQVRKQVRR